MTRHPAAARGRLDLLWIFLYAATAVVALRLFDLQLLRHETFEAAAEKNSTQLIFTSAPRGRIFDRKGRLLATNKATFSLVYLPPRAPEPGELDRLTKLLAPELKEDPAELEDTLKRSMRGGVPVRLAQGLSPQAMFQLSEMKTLVRGINLVVEAERSYPYGTLASHLLGHLGNMDARDMPLLADGYHMDSKIGKSGLEGLFERDLHGSDGGMRLEVDARGRLKRVLERLPAAPGRDVTLTIDADIQRVAEDALKKTDSGRGAVVALDPRTGEVLALASVPEYDPNWFVELPTERGDESLRHVPEFDLALQGTFPPGSVFKIITSAALFNDDKADPSEKVRCPGYFEVGDRVFKCWLKTGHGLVNYWDALAESCDVYYYAMGLRVGGAAIERYEDLFGLGELTHIPLPGEARGRAFGPLGRYGKRYWRAGDTANLAIGQGGVLVTPLQMALLIASVATRGDMMRPRVVSKVSTADDKTIYETQPELLRHVDLKPAVWDLLQKGLEHVVQVGTGKGCQIPGLVVAGKTGTAQNPHGEDHAWFVAYAGKAGEPPSIAVAVLVQNGGHGGVTALPVAKDVIEAALTGSSELPESDGDHAL